MATDPPTAPPQQNEQKAQAQRNNLRRRIKEIASSVMQGRFNAISGPYQPKTVHEPDHPEWQTLLKNQQTLLERITKAKDAMDGGISKEDLIFTVRSDFPDLAKKIPEPVRKARPPPPPTALPEKDAKDSLPVTISLNGKRKQVDDDQDDDEEYDPDADSRAQREERAAKRQRSSGQDTITPAAATELKPMMDEEELEMQIQEIKMKAELAILQLRRKFAADKKKHEQMGAKIKRQGF
ncbi:hypothetical protein M409DRAFT_25946 [Zasmidium cellare ATCC 36951]|uniref:Uncharacterized protein n=1 Tax=Zasmidium cellare ATCC 36951 TaxID=1080233 RepID=A0A6A6CCW3_ZASCE|nr:uncharacterized protein M409DRAFT_25946 [Zasmidium cellare ATCC 36951]KAF2163762.1 hypothetical protein M409DRAFT_25946 [Zasmidium cellare ATCC 36951]